MIPDWLGVRRRGGRFREPGDWLVIGLLVYAGSMMLGAGTLLLLLSQEGRGGDVTIVSAMGVGLAFLAGAFLVYIRWRRHQSRESEIIMQDWSARCRALKSNLQELLEDV